MMNEPPIASPVASPHHSNPKPDAPRLLKVLVWTQFILSLCGLAFSAKNTPLNSPVPLPILVVLLLFALGLSLIPLALLRASKASWWFAQAWFVVGALITVPSWFQNSARASPSLPVWFEIVSWLVGFALFVYLLTPAIRRFFFTSNRENFK